MGGVENIVNKSPIYILVNGGYVVYIFWIVSAFLISYAYYKKPNMLSLGKKALKKYLGLLYYISVTYLIAFLFIKIGLFYNIDAAKITNSQWLTNFYNWNPTILQLFSSIFIDTYFTSNVPFNPVLWTIKVEFLGSLMEILFLSLFGDRKKRNTVWCMIIIFIIFAFPLQYLCFAFGCILGDLYVKGDLEKYDRWGIFLFIISIYFGGYPSDFQQGGGLYSWIPVQVSAFNYVWDVRTIIYISSSLICVLSIMISKSLKKFFANTFFLKLGNYSTEIYMFHFIVECSFSSWCFVKLYNMGINYVLSFGIMLFSSLAVIIVCGKLMKKSNQNYDQWLKIKIDNLMM